jgi:hypothetical protein
MSWRAAKACPASTKKPPAKTEKLRDVLARGDPNIQYRFRDNGAEFTN